MTFPVHAVLAVKNLAAAKTRLAPVLSPPDRAALVLAMLRDTLAAVTASTTIASVIVVTPDQRVGAAAAEAGARVLSETPQPTGSYGLNAALRHGAAEVQATFGPVRILALQADLPALRAAELDDLAAAAPRGRCAVADHRGSGTAALLGGHPGTALDPRFGPDSARAHRVSGAQLLRGQWPGLRLDVDTPADLGAVLRLGAGAATRGAMHAIDWQNSQ